MVSNCKCKKEHKVRAKEREFLQDQRGPRKMVPVINDIEETSQLKRKAEMKPISNKGRSRTLMTAQVKPIPPVFLAVLSVCQ